MSPSSIAQAVTALIEPLLQTEGYDLVEVEYKRDRKNWVLRVFIDKPGGVTLADCQHVSRLIEDRIEVENPIHTSYALEVSSPGLDRPLVREKDYLRNKGGRVIVYTLSPVEGKREFNGVLLDCREGMVIVEERKGTVAIPMNVISKAKRVIEF